MAASKPSIKGSILASHAEVLQKYLASAQLATNILEDRFEPGELETLAGPIDVTRWYDIEMYRRLMEFLRDYDGAGESRYLIDAGRRSAENLIRAGVHQQFEYLDRTQHSEQTELRERFLAFGRDLRLLTTITGSILNFARSEVVEDSENTNRWIIRHWEAEHYPEILCWTSQGFCNRMAEQHGAIDLWYWERPQPDLVHFRMNREI